MPIYTDDNTYYYFEELFLKNNDVDNIIISFFFGRCNIYPKIVYFTNVLCSFLFFFYF